MDNEEKTIVRLKKNRAVTKIEMIRGLRELADFMESTNEDFPYNDYLTVDVFVNDVEKLKACIPQMGTFTKQFAGSYFFLRKQFSGGVKLELNVRREAICKKKVKIVQKPEVYVEAVEAHTIPAREEEVIEWECPQDLSLLRKQEQLGLKETNIK